MDVDVGILQDAQEFAVLEPNLGRWNMSTTIGTIAMAVRAVDMVTNYGYGPMVCGYIDQAYTCPYVRLYMPMLWMAH